MPPIVALPGRERWRGFAEIQFSWGIDGDTVLRVLILFNLSQD